MTTEHPGFAQTDVALQIQDTLATLCPSVFASIVSPLAGSDELPYQRPVLIAPFLKEDIDLSAK
jgi:hypothetical protein